MIKFLRDHEVEGESFKFRQEVKDRSPESELHFVRRGHAVFVRDGKYYDHEDNEVSGAIFRQEKKTEAAPEGARPVRERRVKPRAMTSAAAATARGAAKKGNGKRG